MPKKVTFNPNEGEMITSMNETHYAATINNINHKQDDVTSIINSIVNVAEAYSMFYDKVFFNNDEISLVFTCMNNYHMGYNSEDGSFFGSGAFADISQDVVIKEAIMHGLSLKNKEIISQPKDRLVNYTFYYDFGLQTMKRAEAEKRILEEEEILGVVI
jgi:hypothetical protein